jgi:hypothetical protein
MLYCFDLQRNNIIEVRALEPHPAGNLLWRPVLPKRPDNIFPYPRETTSEAFSFALYAGLPYPEHTETNIFLFSVSTPC